MIGQIAEKLRRLWFTFRHQGALGHLGRGTYLVSPFRMDGPEGIGIGDGTFIQRGGWLYCCGIEGKPAVLAIGSGCVFGYNNHITAVREVRIGDDVLTANNVYISDNVHGYEDITTPIMQQPVIFKQPVSIGSGTWLGENVCIVGASVGRNCVIGANAVVTKDVPDYSVAVGSPARVIKHFDQTRGAWVAGARL